MDDFPPPPPNPPSAQVPPPPNPPPRPSAPDSPPIADSQAIPAEPALVPPVSEGTGLAPNVAAGICAAVPLIGGVIFLALEKRNAFVRFWAMQSVFVGVAFVAIFIVLTVAGFVLAGIPILGWLLLPVLALVGTLVNLAALVLWVVMMVKAFSNVEWEIPYLGKLARRQLGMSTAPLAEEPR